MQYRFPAKSECRSNLPSLHPARSASHHGYFRFALRCLEHSAVNFKGCFVGGQFLNERFRAGFVLPRDRISLRRHPPLTIFSNAAADSDCMTTIREIHSMNRRRISAVTRSPLFDPCGKMAKAGLLTRPPNDTFPVIRPVASRRPVSWTHSSGTVADSHCVPF